MLFIFMFNLNILYLVLLYDIVYSIKNEVINNATNKYKWFTI